MSVEEDQLLKNLTEEDKELLFRDIRPKWMRKELFKEIRRQTGQKRKQYLKGRFRYVAKELVKNDNPHKLASDYVMKSYGPYVKKS